MQSWREGLDSDEAGRHLREREWTVRPAVPADLPEVVSLEREIAEAPHWPQSAYEGMIGDSVEGGSVHRRLFVATAGGMLVGFSAGSVAGESAALEGELETVAVANSLRGQGLGRALCQAVIAWARDLGASGMMLEVRSGSSAPIALYRSLGFAETGRRPRYYRDPADTALQMRLKLG